MNVDRPFRILWGSNLENQLDFTFPVAGDAVMGWRMPRSDSRRATSGVSYAVWMTGRHYRLRVTARYFGAAQAFGAYGLQAFVDWAADSNPFTLVPNIFQPTLQVPGCYLEGPHLQPGWAVEQGEVQRIDLTILHPTADLGVAWRGMFLEWAAGADLSRPSAYPGYSTGSRGVASFEMPWNGGLRSVAAATLRDGHFWPGGGGTWTAAGGNVAGPSNPGFQATLLEPPRANLCLQSNAIATAPWTFNDNGAGTHDSATNGAYVAPDGTVTATRVQEGTNGPGTTHGFQQSVAATFTAGHALAVSAWWRPGQRTKGEMIFSSNQNANYFGVDFDLNGDGTLTMLNPGGATITRAGWLGPFPGDWYWVWVVGQMDAATTTSGLLQLRMRNGAGSNNYTGDNASGCYWWGAQVEDLSFAPATNFGLYAPSSPILTTTAVASRLFDAPIFLAPAPQAMWYYLKFMELGTVIDSAGDACRLISIGAGSPQATWIEASSGKYVADYLTGATQVGSPTGALSAPRYGDAVELLVVLDSDLTIRMSQFIARLGVEEVGSKSTVGAAFPSTWTGGVIDVNSQGAGSYGLQALAQFKCGPLATIPGFQVTGMAAARGA